MHSSKTLDISWTVLCILTTFNLKMSSLNPQCKYWMYDKRLKLRKTETRRCLRLSLAGNARQHLCTKKADDKPYWCWNCVITVSSSLYFLKYHILSIRIRFRFLNSGFHFSFPAWGFFLFIPFHFIFHTNFVGTRNSICCPWIISV